MNRISEDCAMTTAGAVVGFAIFLLLTSLFGCASPPNWVVTEIIGTNAVARLVSGELPRNPKELDKQDERKREAEAAKVEEETQKPVDNILEDPRKSNAANLDEIPFGELKFTHGGFSGSKAQPVSGAVIKGLKVSSGGISYGWSSGGCELLGASDSGDYSHTLACLFYLDGNGNWQGGKFDWISTSRKTRDLKNVKDGYHGWDYDAFMDAKKRAFVIVSSDGKKRTNVIVE